MRTHLKSANFVFHTFAVKVNQGELALLVKLKAHLDLWHELFEFGGFHSAVGIKQSLTECKQCDCAVHGAGINIYVTHLAGEYFSHSAFAT